MRTLLEGLPGFIVMGFLATTAAILAKNFDLSITLTAIFLGFLTGNLLSFSRRLKTEIQTGTMWVESYGLTTAVALLGLQLNFSLLWQINSISLAMMAVAILMTFMVTALFAKIFRVGVVESCLLASGQAICGSAAVMAVTKVLNVPNKTQTGLVIAVINFLGFLGVFIIPELGRYFFEDDVIANGFMIGNTLQSMGHVVAAGFSVGDEVGHGAVIIKMCRILFLIPTLLVLVFWINKSPKMANQKSWDDQTSISKTYWFKIMPFFIWVFLGLILFNNLGWVNDQLADFLIQLSDVLFILAMVAIGLSIRLQDLWQQYSQLLLVAGLVFILQVILTLFIVRLI